MLNEGALFWMLVEAFDFVPGERAAKAMAVLAAAWLLARRAPAGSRARRLGMVWAGALFAVLAIVLLLRVPDPELEPGAPALSAAWRVTPVLPVFYALHQTLAAAFPVRAESRNRSALVPWMGFAALLLTFVREGALYARFPFAGGEFHAMFAYTREGRMDPALVAWSTSVLAVGLCAAVLVWAVPLRWWWLGLIGGAVAWRHWWDVITWRAQSPHFHRAAIGLMIAMPIVILALCGAAEWLRRLMAARSPATAPAPSPPRTGPAPGT